MGIVPQGDSFKDPKEEASRPAATKKEASHAAEARGGRGHERHGAAAASSSHEASSRLPPATGGFAAAAAAAFDSPQMHRSQMPDGGEKKVKKTKKVRRIADSFRTSYMADLFHTFSGVAQSPDIIDVC